MQIKLVIYKNKDEFFETDEGLMLAQAYLEDEEKFSNQRQIFESGDLQQKMKKRSSSANKGFL